MGQNVFILEGHPHPNSFSNALALATKTGAVAAGHEVRHLALSDLVFDMNLIDHDPNNHPFEPDLEVVWDAFLWANHVIVIHPLWWGGAPAKLKGLFDRVLRPRHAFEYEKGKPLPKGLLKGRSAEVMITSDTPTWFFHLVYRYAWPSIMRRQILGFCGLKVGRIRNFGPMRGSSEAKRLDFLKRAEATGRGI